MRLLVTGGAGFIGSNFVHYWLGHHSDDEVVVYDLLTYAGNRESLAPVEDRIAFVEGDICDRELSEATLREHGTDVVVNFAAESHNSLAVVDPTRFFRTNVLGTQTLLDASRATGVGRFHHVSTCEVYGDLCSTRTRCSRRSRRIARARPTTRRRRAPTTPCERTSRPSASR